MKRGKKYIEAAKLIERGNLYEKEEAVALLLIYSPCGEWQTFKLPVIR